MVSAAHVDPADLAEIFRKVFFNAPEGPDQRPDALLAEGVEMESRHPLRKALRKLASPDPETGARRAGVIDGVALLGGNLRVYAQRDPESAGPLTGLPDRPVKLQLGQGIEVDMGADPAELPHFFRLVGGLEDVVLRYGDARCSARPRVPGLRRPPEFLVSKPRLADSGGGGAVQIPGDQRIDPVHGEGLLRQQDLHPGFLPDAFQDLQIFYKCPLLHNVGGGPQFRIFHSALPVSPPAAGPRPRPREARTGSACPCRDPDRIRPW